MNDPNPQNSNFHECTPQSPLQSYPNLDNPAAACGAKDPNSLRNPPGANDFLQDICEQNNKKTNIGAQRNCDPMQTGQIINDLENPNREYIYRYTKAFRGTDEAVQDLFRNVVVLDENGQAHKVPIIYGTQEKAVAAIVQSNVRKDQSMVVDRIRLPIMAIHSSDIQFNQDRYTYHKALDYMRYLRPDGKPGMHTKDKYERDTVFGVAKGLPVDISYTLYAWTFFIEDMNQIVEQVMLKFSPIAYIKVRSVSWEIGVELQSSGNNIDFEPGDSNLRVIKWQFNLLAKSFIPQPIVRRKAVLTTKIDIVQGGTGEQEILDVLTKIEESIGDLEC